MRDRMRVLRSSVRVSTTDGGESGATGLDWLLVVSNQGELVGGVECSDGTEGIPLIQRLED